RLKLFFLSLLWRLGITSLDELKGARLGRHADRIRGMLLSKTPGVTLEYPCLVSGVMFNGKHIGDFIVPPSLGRMEGHHIWSFVVAGILFTFFVSNHTAPSKFWPLFLQKEGSLVICMEELKDIEFLRRFLTEVAATQRRRRGA
ncbi:MAG: hypothetical protein KGS61_07475, partial [Verrucomicrobia bacterium]|nr:hypothetical protein [Verrucomicrobiota bacterium]